MKKIVTVLLVSLILMLSAIGLKNTVNLTDQVNYNILNIANGEDQDATPLSIKL